MTEKKYHSLMLLEIDTEQKAIRAWDCISEILVREGEREEERKMGRGERKKRRGGRTERNTQGI